MAHPKEVKMIHGKRWHKEDSRLKLVEARSLQKHLIHTEDKLAKITHTPQGYEVWWAKK